MPEMYIPVNTDRQAQLCVTEQDIGRDVLFCDSCLYQRYPGECCKSECPVCHRPLHVITVSQELCRHVSHAFLHIHDATTLMLDQEQLALDALLRGEECREADQEYILYITTFGMAMVRVGQPEIFGEPIAYVRTSSHGNVTGVRYMEGWTLSHD